MLLTALISKSPVAPLLRYLNTIVQSDMAKATAKAAPSAVKKATSKYSGCGSSVSCLTNVVGTVRRCSKYNEFIKSELSKVKKENSDLPHKECFRVAAARWKHSPENPNSIQATNLAAKAAPDAST